MSKLIKLMEQLGRENPPRLGFGMKTVQKPNPEMVLLGLAQDIKALKGKEVSRFDGIIFATNNQIGNQLKSKSVLPEEIPWGVVLESPTERDTAQLLQEGCDFIALSNLNVKVEATKEEDLGHFLFMPADLSQEDQQALVGLPIDGIFFEDISSGDWTLEGLLRLSRFRREIGKTFILKLSAIPSSWELECLHNIGIEGLLIEIEKQSKKDINTLSDLIEALPKKSNQSQKLIPSLGNLPNHSDDPIEQPDDDDDDDDF